MAQSQLTTHLSGSATAAPTSSKLRRRIIVGMAVLVLAALVAYFGVSAYAAERFSHPVRVLPTHNPADYGLNYETVQFRSSVDDIPLVGWYIDSPGDKVVLLMHGRDATMDDESLRLLDLAKALTERSYDVFTFDFRGHGLSGGLRYSFGDQERRDVDGALTYLKSRGVKQVNVISFSMGAVTALNTAPDHPEMRAIVADAPFADFGMMVWDSLPQVSGLPSFFTPGIFAMAKVMYGMDFFNNKPANALATLGNRPVFLIHETGDPQIPTSHHEMLVKAGAKNPNVQAWLIQGSDHGQAFRYYPDEYMKRVTAFFEKAE